MVTMMTVSTLFVGIVFFLSFSFIPRNTVCKNYEVPVSVSPAESEANGEDTNEEAVAVKNESSEDSGTAGRGET